MVKVTLKTIDKKVMTVEAAPETVPRTPLAPQSPRNDDLRPLVP
jgi:hypothetical protein